MGIEIIFKIAMIGLLTAVVSQVLKQTGKEEIGTFASLAGLIIVIVMVITQIGELFSTFKTMFNF